MEETHFGELIGFRQWRKCERDLLASSNAGYVWGAGVNEARCLPMVYTRPGFVCPHPNKPAPAAPEVCACGLYGLFEMKDLRFSNKKKIERPAALRLPESLFVPDRKLWVTGVVVGWGETYISHEGWRSQFMRILALDDADCARRYVVRHVETDNLGAFASEFGDPYPTERRPTKPDTSYLDPRRAQMLHDALKRYRNQR